MTLVYEGHDLPRTLNGPNPKNTDQPYRYPSGLLTQNGLFAEAASKYKSGAEPAERIEVYEKIRAGIWAFNGVFELRDSWIEESSGRKVFKFKLYTAGKNQPDGSAIMASIE
jgi:hypothetical protein